MFKINYNWHVEESKIKSFSAVGLVPVKIERKMNAEKEDKCPHNLRCIHSLSYLTC